MNSNNGKLFIIGGSIGLLASTIFLGWALFDAGQPDTESEQIVPTEQTGDITTGTQAIVHILTTSGDKDNTVNILIPEIIATPALANIVKQTEDKNNIHIKVWIETGQNYPDKEKKQILSGKYDIVILPSERLYEYNNIAGRLQMGESLQPFVHPTFSKILNNTTLSYIPIGIDPFVSRTQKNNPFVISTIAKLFNQIALRTQNKKLSIPILLGADNGDIVSRKEGEELYPHQLLFIYTIIGDIVATLDTNGLKNFVDIVNYKTNFTWSSENFKQLVQRIGDRNTACKNYPDICIRVYNFVSTKFGFLSDTYYIQKYFSAEKNNPTIAPFIATQSAYPIRARGAIVHKQTQNLIGSMQFLNTLLSVSIESGNRQTPLLNPYNGQADTTNIPRILNYRDKFKIIWYSQSLQKEIIEKTPLIDLLQNNYNTNIFMQNFRPNITF